ncbi:hypothetical protein Y032_0183g910 [Ancylostoma ceylanicum]|uniref:Uncharacterized protein n=1 Tax=Ancylostoma ceylanicum TaxID=53326 RepID=A0A016SRW4_9BILA|nr:hypothetical protein Y032_0183g910 [Ancylostoma ceylanicum]
MSIPRGTRMKFDRMSKVRAKFFICLVLLHDVFCIHYWKISDDKKRIEAVPDSPYTLAYPGSLVDFLHQVDSVKKFGKTSVELNTVLKSINNRELRDDPELEQRLRAENEHCKMAGAIGLDRSNFKTSYSAELCPDFHKYYERYTAFVKEYFDMTPDDEKLLPRCRQWHQEGQLRGLPKNENEIRVKIRSPDTDYAEILKGYFPRIKKMVSADSPLYGAIIAALLSNQFDKIKAHPYLHMAAAAYWRQNGDLEEALSCYRTAVVYAENAVAKGDESAQVSLDAIHIAAATLFNKADQPDSAIAILEHSFAVDDTTTRSPCVFLKAQAALADAAYLKLDASRAHGIEVEQVADFARVVTYFSEPFMRKLLIPPNDSNYVAELLKLHEVLLKKLGAMSCQIDLFVELAKQKENLDHLVSEKLRFNEVYGDQMKIADQIRGRMISEKMRRSMALGYEEAKYGYNPYRICRTINAKRFPRSNHPGNVVQIYYCDLTDAAAYEESMIPIRKATARNRPLLNDTAWRVAEVFARDKTFDKKLETLKGKAPLKPQIPKKYPLDSATWSTVRDHFWRRADWPNSVDCQAIVSRTDIFNQKWFPQVFISPENKGYVIADYLTRGIGLESHEEHPLPWREPYCKPVDMVGHELSFLTGLVTAVYTRPSPEYAETRLKSVLVRLADRIMEDIEIAQRIRSMMENDVGPRWLSTNLAALYWRVKGNPKQAAYCLIEAILEPYCPTDIALVQLAQVILKVTGQRAEPAKLLLMAAGSDSDEPVIHWLRARLALLSNDVDEALKFLKLSLDKDPFNIVVAEDLLKVACSGKSSRQVISSRFPTVCCSSVVQNAVCFKTGHKSGEQCYVVDTESGSGRLIYNRCNGVYTGASYPTAPYVNIVSPFLPIYNTVSKREGPPFAEDESSVQTIDTEELPLDYGGSAAFFAPRPVEWWTRAKNEMRYVLPSSEGEIDWWEEDGESELAEVPPKPLSFLWIKDRREMLRYDAKLPALLPSPSMHQIRKGLSLFPPPRQSHNLCSGVKKLSILLENQVSTWVSVTAKGEDIAKYVDLRGPVPGVAGLQPVCPSIDNREASPILGLDHLPAFALSDQFLFYKPEKALTDALKSLGNERDSIEHVAARLHTALVANGMGKDGQTVSWLLCVLSSLYWRVVGDAQKAVGCLQCALQTAPQHTRDVALVSLANICHQAGLLHSALIAAGTALSASPNLVAIHFTIANIYASMGDYQRALEFYYSTLSLQMNFEPAKERIRAIYCHSGKKFDFQAV